MDKSITINGKEFLYNCSAHTPIVYQMVTNRCLFTEFSKMEEKAKEKDEIKASVEILKFLVDFLFCICYGSDKKLAYDDFLNSIPMKTYTSEQFIKTITDIIKENFDIEVDTPKTKLNSHSRSKKK